MFQRILCLVADGLGVGEAPDAGAYGDRGSNTLGHIATSVGGLRLPNLERLGLGNLGNFAGVKPNAKPLAVVGKMAEKSHGKDTTTGHWEIAGLVTDKAFALFPQGFPEKLVQAFIREAGLPGVLGNRAASGTVIIEELGEEHLRTGKPILYTSGDSVFQIAAHESKFGLDRLYQICQIARRLTEPYQIGRVIARPFVGHRGQDFRRTENRRDYALSPERNALDVLQARGVEVCSVGKIEDIFDHRGITAGNHTGNNADSLEASLDFLKKKRGQAAFIFTNLVDFDMLYGHRRDPQGYARALQQLDAFLPRLLDELTDKDCLILTADHGCDPTFHGTDHTREYVPLIAYSQALPGADVGVRGSFADVAAAVLEAYEISPEGLPGVGKSFLCRPRK
jgi:phosphopentomutase